MLGWPRKNDSGHGKIFRAPARLDPAPGGRDLEVLAIAVPQQRLEFVGGKGHLGAGGLHAAKPHPGEALVTEPKTLPVIAKGPQGAAPAVQEHEQGPGKGIACQPAPAKLCQAVDAFPEIHWFHRREDPHLGSDLDYADPRPSASTRSGIHSGTRPRQ